ncbi:MAG: STAS domain-containing protein [Clostridiaceae bacterium]|jgi:stage II sporulation protein AA (anti-sigma F factor antagonist)|nr:STAS domain-containing protein [Clostridiaceae bacterium]
MKIAFENKHNTLIAYPDGELDECSSHSLREALDHEFRSERFNSFVMNMSRVSFMDSTGIGVLLGRYKLLRSKNIPFYVEAPTPVVDKILRMSGLYQVITRI